MHNHYGLTKCLNKPRHGKIRYLHVRFFTKSLHVSILLKQTVFETVSMPPHNQNEPPHDKTNKSACAPSEDSDQPGHPLSLIRVFAVRVKKSWVLSYPLSARRRLWSDWTDAQADLSLRWAHSHFVGFIIRQLE